MSIAVASCPIPAQPCRTLCLQLHLRVLILTGTMVKLSIPRMFANSIVYYSYVVLLFTQPPNFDTTASALVNATTPRTNFNISTFGQAVGLGSPIAGTFFLTGPSNSTNTTSVNSTASLKTPIPAPSPTDNTMGTSGASELGSHVGVTIVSCFIVFSMGILL